MVREAFLAFCLEAKVGQFLFEMMAKLRFARKISRRIPMVWLDDNIMGFDSRILVREHGAHDVHVIIKRPVGILLVAKECVVRSKVKNASALGADVLGEVVNNAKAALANLLLFGSHQRPLCLWQNFIEDVGRGINAA
jgi:uncharacterized protein